MPELIVAYEGSRLIQCVSIIPKIQRSVRCIHVNAALGTENVKMWLNDVDNRKINHPQPHCSCVKNQFPKLLK